MKQGPRLLKITLFFVLLSVFPAQANEIHGSSKVVAVTVYPGLAAVTRAGSVKVPAGPQLIVVSNMPAGFNESSLRVQGKAKSPVKIGSVEVKHIFMAELAAAAEQEKAKTLQSKRDEKALIEADLKALQVRSDFIERLAESGNNVPSRPNAPMTVITTDKAPDLAPEKWTQAWSMIQSGMAETQKSIVTKEIAKRSLDEEIAKLEKDYQQIRTSQRERRDVIIHVEAVEDTEFDFTMTYQTRGASWQPLYDARLNTEKGELRMEQYGQVAQQTGEDWGGIELVFSTSRPEHGTEMPRLSEWYIQSQEDIYAQNIIMKQRKGAPANSFNSLDAVGEAGGKGILKEEFADEEEVAATPVSAAVVDTDFAAEFRVPGRVDLKSVAEPAKFFIGEQTMKATMSVQTTPRLGPQAYLFAKVENSDKYPIIPGSVAKYRDGAFMGNASMKMLRPGESMGLAFGVDDRIKVTFQKTNNKQANPTLVVIGDVTMERAYRSKVKNLHKTPIKIAVLDQYPVSRNPDVKVVLLEDITTKGFVKDTEDRQGIIMWEADFQPQEEKAYDTAFIVKYPKGKILPNF